MKILVNKCPDTGTLFEHDKEYRAFRRQILAEKKAQLRQDKSDQEVMKFILDFQETCATFEELEAWMIQNTNKLLTHSCVNSKYFQLQHVQFINMKFSETCSNSHAAPKGGVTNWYRDKDLPMSYPGCVGSMKFTAQKWQTDIAFKMFSLLNLHTGTGGARDGHSQYNVTIFQSDWPNLGFEERLLKGVHT